MSLFDLVFPRECLGCREVGSYLCSSCKKQLHPHPEICPFCHRPSADFQTCFSCRGEEHALEGILIGFSYKTLLKKLILKLKFHHKKDIAPFLAERLALLVQTNQKIWESDASSQKIFISYVPSHRYRKYVQKGYNQSEILAKSLSTQLSLPLISLAQKTKYTKSQVKLNRQQRQSNLKNAFLLKEGSEIPTNATVLFIDDVTTTGSTLEQLAQTVKKNRPDLKIWGIVIARHT